MTPTCTRAGFISLLVFVLVSLAPSALGDENTKKERTDPHGDPLPKGAVARIGTLRWRTEGDVRRLVFSPDGKMLAATNGGMLTASQDRTIRLFDTASGKLLHQIRPPGVRDFLTTPLTFSPDSKYLAYHTGHGRVHLWEPAMKQHVRTLLPKEKETGSGKGGICFSPDGKRLAASVGREGRGHIVIWDVQSGDELISLRGPDLHNPSTFLPEGKIVAIVSDRGVKLFDSHTGKSLRAIDLSRKRQSNPPFELAFSPDCKTVALGRQGKNIVLFDVESGKETAELTLPSLGFGGPFGLAFTPDGKTLISLDEHTSVICWDLATRKERFSLDNRALEGQATAISPDGKTLAMGTKYNVIRFFDVETGKERSIDSPCHEAPVHAVAFSPDGKLLVTAGENARVHLWDAASLRHERRLGERAPESFRWSAEAVSFSPDGKRLAAGGGVDPNVRVWDIGRGKEVFQITHDDCWSIHGVAFAPDGKTLLSLNRLNQRHYPGQLHVWDAATGKRLREVVLAMEVHCLALSPDGKLAVVGGSTDRPLRFCNVESGKEVASVLWQERQEDIASGAFSPDGRILATGGMDRTVRLWEMASRQPIATLRGHDRTVAALAFSPDGRILASGDGGPVHWTSDSPPNPAQRIHLWEVASTKELARLDGYDSQVTSLAFSRDGKRLVSGLSNGTVLVWDMTAHALPAAPTPAELGQKELNALWTDLAGQDASKGIAAVWKLARCRGTVAYLRKHFHPLDAAGEKQLARWIADLDSAVFADREKATHELERQGELAEPLLRKTLANDSSPELRRRIEALLNRLQGPVTSAEMLRSIRAVEVLEHIATPEAHELLRKHATGAPDARLTHEAKAALDRLKPQ